MENKYFSIDDQVAKYLLDNNIDYLPYKYSLEEKKDISDRIKKIINENINTKNYISNDHSDSNLNKILRDQGCFLFDKPLLDERQITDIHNFLKNKKAHPAHVACYDKHHQVSDLFNFKGKIASLNTRDLVEAPHFIELISSDLIINSVTSYLGCAPTLFDMNLIFSYGDTEIYHETHHAHRDHDDFHHVLLMIYLNDVNEDCGPHIYFQKSHTLNNKSSKIKPIILENNSNDDVVDKNDNFEKKYLYGKKGTSFFTDACGLHSGSAPNIGKRRMIFWARYGLSKNYMWEVHNQRYWNYDNKSFNQRISDKNDLKEYIFRLFTKDYDHNFYKNKYTISDKPIKKLTKNNHNIVVYGKYYFAIPQSYGPIDLEKEIDLNNFELNSLSSKFNDRGILVSDNEESLVDKVLNIV